VRPAVDPLPAGRTHRPPTPDDPEDTDPMTALLPTTTAPPVARATRRAAVPAGGRRHRRAAVGFLAPFLLSFLLFYVLPIAYAVYQSFFKIERQGIFGAAHDVWGGFSQYTEVFSDAEFWHSLLRVAEFFLVSIPIQLGLALLFALLLDSPVLRGHRFFRLALFAPYAVPGVIAALMWGFLFSPGTTPIPAFADRFDLLGPHLVMFSIASVVNWIYTGYNMLIIYSALKAIPAEVIEAATVDGAGQVRIAWSIKIPHVIPALVLTGVFSIIGTLQLFNEPQIFRTISSAVHSTYTPNMVVYATSSIPNYHLAAAYSVVLALITCALSFTFLKVTQRRAFQ
jgi:multiple sugar transport system permease protein